MKIKQAIKFIAYKPMALLLYFPLNFFGWMAGREIETFKKYWAYINSDFNQDDE